MDVDDGRGRESIIYNLYYVMGVFPILSLARRLANADIPTGPTLAPCGDEIALNVAVTAPFNAAVVESLRPGLPNVVLGVSIVGTTNCEFCKIHGCRKICAAVGRRDGTMCNI